jgi:hypothetical protein
MRRAFLARVAGAALIVAMNLAWSDLALADSLSNKTITYKSGGMTGGTFSVYIGPTGNVYESNISGAAGAEGIQYKIGKTTEHTTTFTDVLGSKLTCTVNGTATLSGSVLRLTSVYHCSNGNFDHDVTIQIDGSTCSVQRNQRNQGLPFGNSDASTTCNVTSGNQLGAAKWLQ